MALATAGLLGGSALSAGASIAGGFLGQQSNSGGDLILPSSDPRNFLNLQASNFDAASQLGFGDINTIPTPLAQTIDRINGLSLDQKSKRRGLFSLRQMINGEKPSYPRELDGVLIRVGMTQNDLPDLFERERLFVEQRQQLSDISGINQETVRNRAVAGQGASTLIADAARAATGGDLSELQTRLLGRVNRSIDDSEERALLQGRFGGFNPSAALEGIADLRADAELKAIEQSLLAGSNITAALNGGLGAAQSSASISSGAQLGALQIAANQANAANQLQAQIAANNATSLANGVSGGINAFGQGLSTAGALAMLNDQAGGVGGTKPAARGNGSGGFSISGGPGGSTINEFGSRSIPGFQFRPQT